MCSKYIYYGWEKWMMSDSKIVYWYRRNGSMVRERYRIVGE